MSHTTTNTKKEKMIYAVEYIEHIVQELANESVYKNRYAIKILRGVKTQILLDMETMQE